jgi:hypothetical protein
MRNMYIILRIPRLVLMVNGFETYIIYCIALTRIGICHLQTQTSYRPAFLKPGRSESAYDAENSVIPASLFYTDMSIVDLPYGFLLSAKTLCSELVNITEYFWKLLLHQDTEFHYTLSLLMLLSEDCEDSGNVVYMVADEAYFNYQKEKSSY